MIKPNFIQTLTNDFVSKLPPAFTGANQEIQAHLQALLTSLLANMKLVTREEFDIQTKVLAKTRTKLELLEKELQRLSSILNK